MIEKFSYYITANHKIKLYRVVGKIETQADGKSIFKVDENKVAYSYRYLIRNRIGEAESWNSTYNYFRRTHKFATWFDTREAAEEAAQAQLKKELGYRIECQKEAIRILYKRMNEVQMDFRNCGGKIEKPQQADGQVQIG